MRAEFFHKFLCGGVDRGMSQKNFPTNRKTHFFFFLGGKRFDLLWKRFDFKRKEKSLFTLYIVVLSVVSVFLTLPPRTSTEKKKKKQTLLQTEKREGRGEVKLKKRGASKTREEKSTKFK